MENIFDNAYFGKPYKTRDGRKAIYHMFDNGYHILNVDGKTSHIKCNKDGKSSYTECGYNWADIVSEWQEPIDENELQELANEDAEKAYILKDSNYNLWYLVTETFKRGYLKAKQE